MIDFSFTTFKALGEHDPDFAKRMYVYNYRLFDRYDRPVVSLAVLGCAVQRHGLSGGVSPLRQLSLRPVATGAAVAGNQAAESLWCKGVV